MSCHFGLTHVTVIGSMFLSLRRLDISPACTLRTSIGISAAFRCFTSKKQMDVPEVKLKEQPTLFHQSKHNRLYENVLFIKEMLKMYR